MEFSKVRLFYSLLTNTNKRTSIANRITYCTMTDWLLVTDSWLSLESYVTTDSQSAGLCWNKAPIWGLRPDFYYHQTVAGLLIWGALSDERTGLSFTIASGPSQRSHSRVRAPWDSQPYFTVSDLRLLFSSPPTTRRVTVEVFDPASTWPCEL
jgi:predicted Rdx family selenoprotein